MKQQRIIIQRSQERFHTLNQWLKSYHSFSFGLHYNPTNTHHGLLLVNNEDWIKPGTGFGMHRHQDMEIVTWVLEGELEHQDSEGNKGILYPGLVQRMSAGSGIFHSEMNPNKNKDVHLLQMWVTPDTEGIKPGYEQCDISPQLNNGGLIPVASGRGHPAAISIRQKGAVLWAGRLKQGEIVQVPDARHVHIHIARGATDLEGAGLLSEGDAVRLTDAGSPQMTADLQTGSEVLIWETH
ncbi:MAG: pirin family protein [Elusimicrobia bacterium]|nr:pirin family protein [Elusimicrobiota bacterium]